jgi:uncharacterized protein involved in exopolysaccharide biosynthesis
MKDYDKESLNDIIHILDLFSILWAYKIFISIACAAGIFVGVYVIVNTDQEFTASATFKLSDTVNGINSSREVDAISRLAGFSDLNKNKLPVDQVMGREFIESLDLKVDFRGDPYFNTYKPNTGKSGWKIEIKNLIGWKSRIADPNEAMWQGISSKYNKSISLSRTVDGAIIVKVIHKDPSRSAVIANTIMDTILQNSKNKQIDNQNQQLNYLAKSLAGALSELEATQSSLKKFSIENTALPLEEFATKSLKLDTLRDQLNHTSDLQDAIGELVSMLEKNSTTREDYLVLSKLYPIVDQVEFRRVLGQNEIISSWSWPKLALVKKVFNTLTERKERLIKELSITKLDADTASNAVGEYARLKRDATIAEASYTVLIENVKAQTMMAGYRPDTSEIYEYAAEPLNPSAPKKKLILIAYTLLGIFIGCIIPLTYAVSRGTYYSHRSLFKGANAQLNINARPLLSLRKRDLIDIPSLITNRQLTALRYLATEVHKDNTNQIIITSARSRLKSIDLANALATYMQTEQYNIGIINLSEKTKMPRSVETVGSFFVKSKVGKISHLQPKNIENTIDFLGKRDFQEQLKIVQSKFDKVFLCADNIDAISLARAISGSATLHLAIAKLKHTQSQHLTQLRKLLTIRGLLYE